MVHVEPCRGWPPVQGHPSASDVSPRVSQRPKRCNHIRVYSGSCPGCNSEPSHVCALLLQLILLELAWLLAYTRSHANMAVQSATGGMQVLGSCCVPVGQSCSHSQPLHSIYSITSQYIRENCPAARAQMRSSGAMCLSTLSSSEHSHQRSRQRLADAVDSIWASAATAVRHHSTTTVTANPPCAVVGMREPREKVRAGHMARVADCGTAQTFNTPCGHLPGPYISHTT